MAKVVLNPTLQSIEGITEPKRRSNDDLAIKAYAAFSKKKLAIDKKLEDQLAKYRNGKLAEFEKTKFQKLKEANELELKFLRIKWEREKDESKKAEIERDIQRKKRQQKDREAWNEVKKQFTEGKTLGEGLANAFAKSLDAVGRGINTYLGSYSQYMSGIEARIQGSTKSFKGMTGLISRNLAGSPYVSQTKMLENLNNLIAQGIVYNVEQRAFLQTVSDKMVTTFDALDTNLREIIKIQQADSTAARLGLEAELTQFLNANFGDTSYLNSLFDSIAGALIGTSSQLGRDRSVAFEYNIQKWLGSLSSVGVSGSTIQSLAKGINYLGTSDISALTGDEQLLRLFSIGAQQAGLDIGSIMTNGLTPDDANKLMRGVVELGQQIASNSNQVIKSQLGQLFGFTMSDLTAILNLKDDLDTLTKSVIDYTGAVQETRDQLQAIPGRVTLKDRIDTLFNNVMAGLGESIANNAATYTTWVVNELIKGATGGGVEVNIPFLGAVNLNNAVSAGIAGMGLISQVGNIIGGLQRGSGLDLDTWGESDTVRKAAGWGFTGITSRGASTTQSRVMYIGSQDSDMLLNQSLLAGTESTKQISSQYSEAASPEVEESRSNSIIKALSESENIKSIVNLITSIENRLSSWDSIGGVKVTVSGITEFGGI